MKIYASNGTGTAFRRYVSCFPRRRGRRSAGQGLGIAWCTDRRKARERRVEPDRSKRVPDVSGKVLASSETQVARRILGAVEALRLFLRLGLGAIGVDALVIRGGIVGGGVLAVRVVHFDVFRVSRLLRVLRVLAFGRGLFGRLWNLDGLGKW